MSRRQGGPRIAIIHAVRGAIDPIGVAFAALWPEARTDNLLEESLSTDIAEAGAETEAIQERIADLAAYVTKTGADAILYSCSAFGDLRPHTGIHAPRIQRPSTPTRD